MIIGVLTAQIDEPYQSAVWKGIETRARQLGIGVICFAGRRIDSPVASEAAANIVYSLADNKNLDGLIVVSTTIATFINKEEIGRFFSSRKGLPQVSVGVKVPKVSSITVDGLDSIAYMVRHLVHDHHRTRFALIGGPPGHPEAEEREQEFRKVLKAEAIEFNEALAVRGDFLRNSGSEAVIKILDAAVPFDSIFCSNDRMAFGALDMLHQRGFRVPEDVAVVGFDGVEESSYKTPPLTTVIQPLTELGSGAVEMLLNMIKGLNVPDRVLICRPLIRQSCGCPPAKPFNPEAKEIPPGTNPAIERSLEELASLGADRKTDIFISRLNQILSAQLRAGGNIRIWNDFLSIIKQRIEHKNKPIMADGETEPVFEYARVLIGDMESRDQAERRIAAENKLATLRSVGASLSGGFEMPVMLKRFETGLRELGLAGGFLVLFEDRGGFPQWSRLMMAPREGGEKRIPVGGVRFSTSELLPRRKDLKWREASWVLEPLVFQSEPLGYMMLPGGLEETAVYDALAEQVSSALKGTLLLQQVRTHERRLEEEVARRTAELTKINRELTREIERRMRLEQEVTEISNLTMQRIGQDLHDDICQHLAGITMLSSVLRSRLTETDPGAAEAIKQIDSLLFDSIARTKKIARGLYPAGLSERGLVSAVKELVDSARRNYQIPVDFNSFPGFHIPDNNRAMQLYRIIQEALTNALRHSGSDRVTVSLHFEEGIGKRDLPFFVAEVCDYGKGMPGSFSEKGMGLRIMRYRAETIGAELLIERLDPGTRVKCRFSLPEGKDNAENG